MIKAKWPADAACPHQRATCAARALSAARAPLMLSASYRSRVRNSLRLIDPRNYPHLKLASEPKIILFSELNFSPCPVRGQSVYLSCREIAPNEIIINNKATSDSLATQ